MTIYLTHCSRTKDDSLAGTGRRVTPDALYTAQPTVRFMNRCRETGVHWAILSDYYGIWFPNECHEWYGDREGDPKRVDECRFAWLLDNFDTRLSPFDEIWIYRNPGRFHGLYQRIIEASKLRARLTLISRLAEIIPVP